MTTVDGVGPEPAGRGGPRSLFWTLRWRLALPYMLIIVVVMAILEIWIAIVVRDEYRDQLGESLTDQATLVAQLTGPAIVRGESRESIDQLIKNLVGEIDARVTVIRSDGVVLGETDISAAAMENHSSRPEFIEALSGETGQAERYSTTEGEQLLYVAVPVGDPPFAVARVAVPTDRVNAAVWDLQRGFLFATVLAAILAMAFSLFAAGRISTALDRLRRQARAVAVRPAGRHGRPRPDSRSR